MNQMTLVSLDFLVALFTLIYLVKLVFQAATEGTGFSGAEFNTGFVKRSLRNQRISAVR